MPGIAMLKSLFHTSGTFAFGSLGLLLMSVGNFFLSPTQTVVFSAVLGNILLVHPIRVGCKNEDLSDSEGKRMFRESLILGFLQVSLALTFEVQIPPSDARGLLLPGLSNPSVWLPVLLIAGICFLTVFACAILEFRPKHSEEQMSDVALLRILPFGLVSIVTLMYLWIGWVWPMVVLLVVAALVILISAFVRDLSSEEEAEE